MPRRSFVHQFDYGDHVRLAHDPQIYMVYGYRFEQRLLSSGIWYALGVEGEAQGLYRWANELDLMPAEEGR